MNERFPHYTPNLLASILRWAIAVILLLGLVFPFQNITVKASSGLQATVTVFATGLDNPRGLKFGPDGSLYVAEGGQGGTESTVGQCEQVPEVGPYTGGMTARISKINEKGERTTVVDHLPSSQTNAETGGEISGVSDVAFIHDRLYALLSGAGCSHGIPQMDNGVIRVNEDGSWKMIANLSEFLKANPVQNPDLEDFEPDGTWYSMIAVDDDLYAVEPNHGELDRITTSGEISRVVDLSASQGHSVPTSLGFHSDHFYIGNLTTFPLVQGAAKILQINRDGNVKENQTNLTNIVGALHDPKGNLYVLESTVNNPLPTPGSGQITRIDRDDNRTTVVTGLSLPTAMTFGPDGALYVSNRGFGFPAGMGEVVRVDLND
jgi:hypothetical protein